METPTLSCHISIHIIPSVHVADPQYHHHYKVCLVHCLICTSYSSVNTM